MCFDKPKSAINKLSFNKFFNKTFAFNTSRHCKGAANDKYKHQYTKSVYKGDGRRILKHSYVICFANKLKHYYRHIGLRRFGWLQLPLFLYARKKKKFPCVWVYAKKRVEDLFTVVTYVYLIASWAALRHTQPYAQVYTYMLACVYFCMWVDDSSPPYIMNIKSCKYLQVVVWRANRRRKKLYGNLA